MVLLSVMLQTVGSLDQENLQLKISAVLPNSQMTQ